MSVRRLQKPPRHPLNPRIAGIRMSVLIAHYRARLRRQLASELLAGAGIAVGVALLFGVLLASASSTGSAAGVIRAVNGNASLQLYARSQEGFPEALAQRAGSVPGVRYAAFVLRENGQLIGPGGSRAIQIVGVSSDIAALHGRATQSIGAQTALLGGGVGLPAQLAASVGARSGDRVRLLADGDAHTARVSAVLGADTIGPVAQSPIAIALLEVAQRIAERPGRVTEVLIEPRRGATARVAAELRRLLAGRVSVRGANAELRVLEATARPLRQSTDLFAAIGAMVGLLFVVNAMLLSLPERRRLLRELHIQGFEARQILTILVFQALILGVLASLAGLALGDLLARTVFHESPVYLAAAFPIGSQQSIPLPAVLLAFGGGVIATLLASISPLLAPMRSGGSLPAGTRAQQTPHRVSSMPVALCGALAGLIVLAATAIAFLDAGLTVLAGVMLALASTLLVVPLFALMLRVVGSLGRGLRGATLTLAAVELRSTATRSIALIGVAALAVYGSVAIEGARGDLQRGLDTAVVEFLDTAQVWVAPNNDFLTIDSFRNGGAQRAIERAPGVASVRPYAGGLLDVGERRLWIRARSPRDSRIIQASQLLHGNLARASALIRGGGYAAVSSQFAAARHLRLGSAFTLPTPSGPARLRVAAITTNAGWSPGAITLSLADYRRLWQSSAPNALEVSLRPGVSPAAGAAAVRRALAGRPGLIVQSTGEREASFQASAREGLRSLGEIATLLLITAALAVAAVLSASIWQRRARLAALKVQGFDHMQLWRAVVLESGIAVAVGCLDGALIGLYGHALASRWLALSTGFPAPFSLGLGGIAIALAIVLGITVLLVAALGLHSARVRPSLAFEDRR
jgi:putative ABC transport system permease protein